jgi:predicted nuclease of predicted toxin-antitoxin system
LKLLFDHHLSPTLIVRLGDLFPGSDHVWNLALHEQPDPTVWLHARDRGFTIVSKDADFSEISMELGYPPKLIWLQIDNWSTDQVEELIRSSYAKILALQDSTDRAILVLYKSRTATR